MTKTDQINMLVRQIGDLIKKQSDEVLWEKPSVKVYHSGKQLDVESVEYDSGELVIHCYKDLTF